MLLEETLKVDRQMPILCNVDNKTTSKGIFYLFTNTTESYYSLSVNWYKMNKIRILFNNYRPRL